MEVKNLQEVQETNALDVKADTNLTGAFPPQPLTGNAPAALPEWMELTLKDIPNTDISGRREVHDGITHYLETITDFEAMSSMSACPETDDPLLWLNVSRAFHQSEHALKAAIDAQCAHAIARTLLLDRNRRKEAREKRGSIRHSDAFTNLLNEYAQVCNAFYEEYNQHDPPQDTPEGKALMEKMRDAEMAVDTFIETYYAD